MMINQYIIINISFPGEQTVTCDGLLKDTKIMKNIILNFIEEYGSLSTHPYFNLLGYNEND